MTAPNTVEELLQLMRQSGMVDEQKLTASLHSRKFTSGHRLEPHQLARDLIQDGVITRFQSEQFLLGKCRGFTIGKYKLLERVGVGGMGQVFLCEHMFMRKRVALKVLPPAKADNPGALGRFYREARASGSLEHTNIVRTHDIDHDGNLHFIVMDYIDGPNLLDVVKKFGAMDIRRAISYVRQVALGLEYASRNSIIHRDIKPSNILIDRRGVARILDMGLARFLNDQGDQLTLKYDDKIVLGTADYVAPEQIANSHEVDIRADIYALGASLYFLLAGHPPFPIGTVSQKLLWHRMKDPTPIQQLRPEVSDELAAIVEMMMSKDPRARYQTPAEVAKDLAPFLTEPVSLPLEEEMPVHSPAVKDGMNSEAAAEPATISPVRSTKSAVVTATAARKSAVLPRPVANPFGATTVSPWGSAPVPARDNTPPSSFPALKSLPSAPPVQIPTLPAKKKFPLLLIAAGIIALLAFGILLAWFVS